MNTLVVAIDGYSGCGKSSTARGVAKALDFTYIDSGAMYRAATLFYIRKGIKPENENEIADYASTLDIDFVRDKEGNSRTYLEGEDVEEEIRSMEVSGKVSQYSKIPVLRKSMVALQRKMSIDKNVIMDGRDIGTVVFPDADLKFFMTAKALIRAKRRQIELAQKGIEEDLETIRKNLEERDKMDTERETSPLRKAEDAIEIDTSSLTLDQQISQVIQMIKERQQNNRNV